MIAYDHVGECVEKCPVTPTPTWTYHNTVHSYKLCVPSCGDADGDYFSAEKGDIRLCVLAADCTANSDVVTHNWANFN